MSQDKYVAYVSTYTMAKEDNYGIKIYDVDMKNGRLSEKNQVEITNSSYITNISIPSRILAWKHTRYCPAEIWRL